MAYPVTYQADYIEKQSRLTTFFRIIVAIPWLIVAYFWALVGGIGVLVGWFGIVITGRYPEFAYDWVSKSMRYNTRVSGWLYLMTDEWPPFDGGEHPEYPIRLVIPPVPQEKYSRAKAFFRIILAIPVLILAYVFLLLAQIIAFLAWFVILFTGKFPRGLFDVEKMGMRYASLANMYHYLITETYPPISEEPDEAARPPVAQPPVEPSPFGA